MSQHNIALAIGPDPQVKRIFAGSPEVTTTGQVTVCANNCFTEADMRAIGLVDSTRQDAGLVSLLGVRHAALIAA
ncbi:hypothetical protein [Catenulispora subtropica]|uniref:Uncharacterized protein n=1 Tax=Catenulispora subtropica TaxID=450798 RepID=A0ABP5D415_9ACTN